MTITEFMENLRTKFTRHQGEVSAWTDGYARILGNMSPDELRICNARTLDDWKNSWPPRPIDFHQNRPIAALPALASGEISGGEKMKRALERRKLELRGWIDRTFEFYSGHVDGRARAYDDEPCNCYRASVVAKLEVIGRFSKWYEKFQQAPHHCEFTDDDWSAIDKICAKSERYVYGGVKKYQVGYETTPEREDERHRSIERSIQSEFYSGESGA